MDDEEDDDEEGIWRIGRMVRWRFFGDGVVVSFSLQRLSFEGRDYGFVR